jgi:predicted DNA-binding WGR domain protein
METLIKVDPERHMYRWYSVEIQSTLVDGIAVVYGWGSLKSAFQQWRTIRVDSQREAEEIFSKIVNTKLEKGYTRRETIELGAHCRVS